MFSTWTLVSSWQKYELSISSKHFVAPSKTTTVLRVLHKDERNFNTTDLHFRSLWGPRTPLRTTEANLDCVFLVLVVPVIGWCPTPLGILSQQWGQRVIYWPYLATKGPVLPDQRLQSPRGVYQTSGLPPRVGTHCPDGQTRHWDRRFHSTTHQKHLRKVCMTITSFNKQ